MRFRSRFAIALAAKKAAQTGDHADVFTGGGRRAVDNWSFENETGEGLPVVLLTEYRARNVGRFATQFRHVVDAPSDDHIDRQTGFNRVGIAQLSFFDLATTLQGLVINLNTPTLGIPGELLGRFIEGRDPAGR